jgi:exopolysaccharide biosynthesis polyprenyl glycosylphosphotransferase
MDFSCEFLYERPPDWYYLLPIIWLILLVELYDVRRAGRVQDTFQVIAIAAAVMSILYAFIFFLSEPHTLPRRGVAGFIAAATVLTLLWRLLYIRIFTAKLFMRRVLIIGAGRSGSTLAGIMQEGKWVLPYILVGFIDDDRTKISKKVAGLPVLGGGRNLLKTINKEHITDLIFSISGEIKPAMYKAILAAIENGVEVTTMPNVHEDLLGRVPIFLLEDEWIIRSFVDQAYSSSSYEAIKRLLDIVIASVGLIILLLLFPLISLVVFMNGGFPIIFRQKRLGKSGRGFELLKFRTMIRDAEKDGKARFAVENDERVTRVGRFMRRSHLDELPQLINVLRGELSLVGPRAERPELINQLQKRIPFYRARLLIKPGVTGWAQINYRYAANVRESAIKLEYDLYYIKNRNLLLDILILIRTLGAVFGFRGL